VGLDPRKKAERDNNFRRHTSLPPLLLCSAESPFHLPISCLLCESLFYLSLSLSFVCGLVRVRGSCFPLSSGRVFINQLYHHSLAKRSRSFSPPQPQSASHCFQSHPSIYSPVSHLDSTASVGDETCLTFIFFSLFFFLAPLNEQEYFPQGPPKMGKIPVIITHLTPRFNLTRVTFMVTEIVVLVINPCGGEDFFQCFP